MRLDQLNEAKSAYTAYVLDEASRSALLGRFPPKYPKVIAHHVTVRPGTRLEQAVKPAEAVLVVVGYVDSQDGLEALVVTVDGSTERSIGGTYHITWSLDPTRYKPVDSNKVLASLGFTAVESIPIRAVPEIIPIT